LIVAGKHDAMMTPDVVESMQRAFSDSTVKVLQTGHASAIEAPDDFNQIVVDFMKRLGV
jgi:pimeloyl-ACP methyl ester carboxylesterase